MKIVINTCYGGFGLSPVATQWLFEHGVDEPDYKISRTNPTLVACVEALGQYAGDELAELKVIEIPDDVQYDIEEFGGKEKIHEKHRVWY